jgi:NitT/TauT family transport system ATP-binding protein/sulfonate transport system ATP-binding protein
MTFDGGADLFSDLTLVVPAGQVVALLGPSGIGKTTLLRILAGVETGFDGTAVVGGMPAHLAPAPAMVFQDARILPWLTAEQNLRAMRPELTSDQCAKALGAVGLAGQGTLLPRQMSGGMQRRLGLARAMVQPCGLMLLDEPFVSLDQAVARQMQDVVLRHLQASRASAILVSHDPGDAARLAQRAVMLQGRPAQIVADVTLSPHGAPLSERSEAQIADLRAQIEAAGPRTAG